MGNIKFTMTVTIQTNQAGLNLVNVYNQLDFDLEHCNKKFELVTKTIDVPLDVINMCPYLQEKFKYGWDIQMVLLLKDTKRTDWEKVTTPQYGGNGKALTGTRITYELATSFNIHRVMALFSKKQ